MAEIQVLRLKFWELSMFSLTLAPSLHSSIIVSVDGRDIGHRLTLIMPTFMKPFLKLTVFNLNESSVVLIFIVNINDMKQSHISWLFNYFIFNVIICMTLEVLWTWW